MKQVRDTCQCDRLLKVGDNAGWRRVQARLAVRYKPGRAEFVLQRFNKVRPSTPSDNFYRHKEVSVSGDLATLIVLFVGSLVPAGVLADRLEEEHPDLNWVSDFLREWDTLEGVTDGKTDAGGTVDLGRHPSTVGTQTEGGGGRNDAGPTGPVAGGDGGGGGAPA